jgi:hypothetical protein
LFKILFSSASLKSGRVTKSEGTGRNHNITTPAINMNKRSITLQVQWIRLNFILVIKLQRAGKQALFLETAHFGVFWDHTERTTDLKHVQFPQSLKNSKTISTNWQV